MGNCDLLLIRMGSLWIIIKLLGGLVWLTGIVFAGANVRKMVFSLLLTMNERNVNGYG